MALAAGFAATAGGVCAWMPGAASDIATKPIAMIDHAGQRDIGRQDRSPYADCRIMGFLLGFIFRPTSLPRAPAPRPSAECCRWHRAPYSRARERCYAPRPE